MTRNHRIAGAIGALALTSLLSVGTATAAVDARLDGKFKVRTEITGGDGPPPVGTVLNRTHKFKPLCDAGPCDQVAFSRQTSTGSYVKTTLDRIAPGIYEGTEVQENPVCADGSDATSRVGDIHIEITRKERGKAARIKGTNSFVVGGCDETFQESSYKGRAL